MHIPHKTIFLSICLSLVFFIAGYFIASHAHAQTLAMREYDRKADVFHLDKDRASEYKTINPSYYEHTGILGTSAAFLVIILLGWVYYQNYQHARRNKVEE